MSRYAKILYILAVGILAVAPACSSSRSAKKQQQSTAAAPAAKSASKAEWQDLRMPVRVALSEPMSFSMSGNATMLRDSIINISMRVIGMEVAVIQLNTDSMYIVDKFHKYYFAEPLSAVLGSHIMPVADIQDIILGTQMGEAADITFTNPGSPEPVRVKYSDFVTTIAGNIASDINITAPVTGKSVDASLQWNVSKAKFNTGATVRFKTPEPDSYRRISMANVLQMLKNN